MHLNDPSVYVTLLFVGLIGVLLLGAHQVDEAGHRRAGIVLLCASIAALLGAVVGPYAIAGMIVLGCLYSIFLGLPVLTVVLLVRRARRMRRPHA